MTESARWSSTRRTRREEEEHEQEKRREEKRRKKNVEHEHEDGGSATRWGQAPDIADPAVCNSMGSGAENLQEGRAC
ncbi:MAG: hypothetical protein JXQ29_02700, partial [Planctomycetes bacterium]|nr:hypothetical protein [Planctomycetota bacterium]